MPQQRTNVFNNPFPVRTKKPLSSDAKHSVLPSDLFVRCPLALNRVEARLFSLALGCLNQNAKRLDFQLTFEDVLGVGSADSQFAKLDKAQKRLTQTLKYETLRLGHRVSHHIPLFTEMSIDQDTGLVTGVFNYYLRNYLLDLSGEHTTATLEALLMRR